MEQLTLKQARLKTESNIRKTFKTLLLTHDKYIGAVGGIEYALSSKVDFDFYVQFQPSDGHCLGNLNTANIAPLSACIEYILRNGNLSEEVHKKMCV